jgi:hypothetical protein
MRAVINSRDVQYRPHFARREKGVLRAKVSCSSVSLRPIGGWSQLSANAPACSVSLQRVIALNRRVQTDRFFGGFPSMQAWHKLCRLRLWEVAYHGGG